MTRWNGSEEPKTKDDVLDRYTLTRKGVIAAFPRGACGHIICAGRDACAFTTGAGK